MKVLIINPILYTAETRQIPRVQTIKDTMIYDLCLAFSELGHQVTLFAAADYRPVQEESYPFPVIWGKCVLPQLFMPHRFPFMPEVISCLRQTDWDLVLSSEVFSMNSLMAVWFAGKRTILWHELAKHNAMLHKIPSKFWYHVIARLFMQKVRVVPRSKEAGAFIRRYCKNTLELVIDHGVNLEKFAPGTEKDDSFVICSQLIPRKRIDGIFIKFRDYLKKNGSAARLHVIGDGECKESLQQQAKELEIAEQVIFLGKLPHKQLLPYLARAQALLINTEKDNSMISIVEAIAVGTPVITTTVPLNASYIQQYQLGIAADDWDASSLEEIVARQPFYHANCMAYREQLSTRERVRSFERLAKTQL